MNWIKILILGTLATACTHQSKTEILDTRGRGFYFGFDAGLLARELTDEEIDNADKGKGCGFSDSRRSAEDAEWMPVKEA